MFTPVDVTPFPSRRLVAKRYRHTCGMEVLSMEADDPENLFCLCFSTEAENDTGVAHIVEHSVLEGSRRYPVKDPFVCLLKSSVATFLNACTYPDRTIYPFITCCPQDYFNLLEVYWDACFHPLLTPQTLGQEGWHHELHGKGKDQTLTLNGIVHNEMSGYYSNPATVMGRVTEKALFPHTSLRYDSGGVPERIPSLTYRQFVDFHHSHYHPSVAKVVLYGNIPTEEKLAVLERHLQSDLAELGTIVPAPSRRPLPPAPGKPRVCRRPFVPDPSSQKNGTGLVALTWALDEGRDMELDLLFQLLEAILLGHAAAPLTRALMESGLGSALLGSGYDNETRFASFSVGMRGVKPKDFPRFEKLVFSVLRECAEKGFPRETVEGAITRFQAKNQVIGRDYVYELLEDVVAAWQYGDDPFLFLRQSQRLPLLQELLRKNPRRLEEILETWFLRNPRRVRVELRPDPSLKARQDARQEARLARKLAGWSERKRERTLAFQRELQQKALQEDSPEALATIPLLRRTDLPSSPAPLPYEDGRFPSGLRVRRSTDFTNGLSELAFTLDASSLPPELVPYLGLFTRLLPRVGTRQETYDQFNQKWARLGAVFSLTPLIHTSRNSPEPTGYALEASFASLDPLFPQAAELFRQRLMECSFRERKRLHELLRADASAASAALLKRENFLMGMAIAADGLSPALSFSAQAHGPADYQLVQELARLPEDALDDLAEKMEAIARWLRGIPAVASAAATETPGVWSVMEETASLWKPQGALASAKAQMDAFHHPRPAGRREYVPLPTKVHTNLRLLPAPHDSHPDYVPLLLGTNLLSTGYLWDRIRAKGGAYGCTLTYQPASSLATLRAHDDPHCQATYQAFDGILDFLHENPFPQEAVDRAILQVLGPMLTPRRPAEAVGFLHALLRRDASNETRAKLFEEVQKTTPAQVLQALENLLGQKGNDCALGPREDAPDGFTLHPLPV